MDKATKIAISLEDDDKFSKSDLLELGEEASNADTFFEAKTWERINHTLDIIFKVVLIVAGAFGAKEYYDGQYEAKIQNALQIVDDWEDQGYLTEYAKFKIVADATLAQAENKYPNDKQSATRSASNKISDLLASSKVYEDFISLQIFNLENSPDYQNYKFLVERLNYFYSKVGLCVRDEICEPQLMRDYFGSSSCYFYDLLETHFKGVRIDNENLDYAKFTENFCIGSR